MLAAKLSVENTVISSAFSDMQFHRLRGAEVLTFDFTFKERMIWKAASSTLCSYRPLSAAISSKYGKLSKSGSLEL